MEGQADDSQLKPGLFGKHPARGDFIDHGLSPAVISGLERWLDRSLTDCRTLLGTQWEAVWDAMAPTDPTGPDPGRNGLCFWIGEALAGAVLAGVLRPSRDKVGRRYPLLLLVAAPGPLAPLPPMQADPMPWIGPLAARLDDILRRDAFDQTDMLLDGFTLPVDPAAATLAGAAELIALRADTDVARLLSDGREADYRRAAAQRSYWWRIGDGTARLYAGPGLPDGRALAWFLTATASRMEATG